MEVRTRTRETFYLGDFFESVISKISRLWAPLVNSANKKIIVLKQERQ